MIKANNQLETAGTSNVGGIVITYAELVKAFGEPNTNNDGYKTDAEWIMETPKGVATIYNYKNGQNYLGDEGCAVEDITEWHIGGHNKDVADEIINALKF